MDISGTKTVREESVTITTLINDIAEKGFRCEHGLAFWIEYGRTRVLFDTGQSDLLLHNARKLGIDLANTDAIVISHGHYDHTGGLADVLERTPKAKIFIHPEATQPKFSLKANGAKPIGMSASSKKAIRDSHLVWTAAPAQIVPGIWVTGQIPRTNNYEDTGGAFFLDEDCLRHDTLPDDQSLLIETSAGLVVIFGCAHAGVVNTLHYAAKISGVNRIYAVFGGMHLLHANIERLQRTISALKKFDVQMVDMSHCTGENAVGKIKCAFPRCSSTGAAGKRVELRR